MRSNGPSPEPQDLLAQTERLRGLIRRLVLDEATVDDVLQDTVAVALQSPPRHQGNPGGWLRTVAKHLAFRHRRGALRRAAREEAAARPEAQPPTLDVVAALEWQQRLTAAVMALDEPYRATVVNRYLRGLDAQTIAQLDGISTGAVNARLRRALQTLRRSLDAQQAEGRSWARAFLPLLVAPELPTPLPVPAPVAPTVGAAAFGSGVVVTAAAAALWFLVAGSSPETTPVERAHAPAAREAVAARPPVLVGTGRVPPRAEPTGSDPEAATPARDAPGYLERINDQDVAATPGIVSEILALGAREARDVLRSIYPRIELRWKRLHLLEAVAGPAAHRYAIAVLRAGLTDPSATVRGYAYERLAAFGLPVNADDPHKLSAWWARHEDRTVADVLEDETIAFVERVRHLRGHTLAAELTSFGALDERLAVAAAHELDLVATLERLDFPYLLAAIAADAEVPTDGRVTALVWLERVEAGERVLAEWIRPLLDAPAEHPGPVVRAAALLTGRRAPGWALPALLQALLTTPRREDWSAVSRALALLGHPAAVPTLIAVAEAAPTPQARDRVARNGLAPLLGVAYRRDLEASWWRRTYASRPDALPVPDVSPRAAQEPFTQENGR